MKRNKWLFIFIFLSQHIQSQITIKGVVTDIQSNVLSNINVYLKLSSNQGIIQFTTTDDKGNYEIIHNELGSYELFFTSLNFEKIIIPLEIVSTSGIIIKNVALKPSQLELKEVIVIAEKPITIRNDTIVYKVASFKKGDETVVEDILKNLPGITVESNGTVKFGNKEVEKIMIEGDDFFEKKYKLLSKNMPSFTIDKVEVIQKYSENKLLKNIEGSDKVALNLKLIDNFKNVWFGNISGANNFAVENNRHQVNANIINIGKKSKHYFLANLNNIGQDFNTTNETNKTESETIVIDNLINTQNQTPILNRKRFNFNNQRLISLNSITDLSKKIKLKTNGYLFADEVFFSKNRIENVNVNDITFLNIERLESNRKVFNGNAKIDLSIDLYKRSMLETSTNLSFRNFDNFNSTNFNSDVFDEITAQKSITFNQNISFTHKINEKSAFFLSSITLKDNATESFFTSPYIYNLVFGQDAKATNQNINRSNLYNLFESKFILKQQNDNLFELSIGNDFKSNDYQTKFSLLNDSSTQFPTNFQNDFNYKTNDLFLKSKYVFTINKIAFTSSLSFHNIDVKFNDADNNVNQNLLLLNSSFGASFKISNKNIFLGSVSYNAKNTDAVDVLPNFYNDRFRSFTRGLNSIDRLSNASITINHLYGTWAEKFSINSIFVYTKDFDFLSTNSFLSQNITLNERIILKNRENYMFLSSVNQYLKPFSSNLKLNISGNIFNNRNQIEIIERSFINTNFNYGFELRTAFKGKFQCNVGSKWTYNLIDTGTKTSFTDNISFVDLLYSFNSKLNFKLQTERNFLGNLNKDFNTYYFVDFELRYILKENKLSLSMIGNNLFNTKTYRDFILTDISTINNSYQLQPRFALLKIEYRLP